MSGETDGCINMATEPADTSFDSNAYIIVETINKDLCGRHFTEMSQSDGKEQQQDTATHHVVDAFPFNMNVNDKKVISKSPIASKYNCCLVRESKHELDKDAVEAVDKAIRDSYFAMISSGSGEHGTDSILDNMETVGDDDTEPAKIMPDESTVVGMFGTEFNGPIDNTDAKCSSHVADILVTVDDISSVTDVVVGTTTDNNQLAEFNGSLAVGGHLCKLCGESFKTSYYLSKHKRIHTGQERPHVCQLCDKRFTQRGQLRKHLRIHTGTKPYKCTVCQKQFTQSHNLKRHILIHTGEQPYQCSICNQSFTCASNTKRHVLLKHPEDVDSRKVSTSAAPDKGAADLETVLESLIKRNIPKQNSLKELKFGSKVDIPKEESEELYMEKRQPATKQEKICMICDREFKKTSHLKDHMRRHTGQRPFICHICGKGSTVRSALNKHLRVHSGERPFKCEVCQKGFTSTSDRDAHQQLHYKERAYQCGLCSAQFVKPYMLMRHMMSIHRAERPYKCDICAKAFKTNSHLSAHKHTHGKRKKKCELCEKEFKYFTDLTKHKQMHSEKIIP